MNMGRWPVAKTEMVAMDRDTSIPGEVGHVAIVGKF
jgi:hypothetical protein